MPAEWPRDAWFPFLEAREKEIASMRAAGFSYEKILATLNLQDVEHVRYIAGGDRALSVCPDEPPCD